MKISLAILALAGLVNFAGGAAADEAPCAGLYGTIPGEVFGGTDENPCPGSTLYSNDDGEFEMCFGWQYAGVEPPYYGAFAEGYEVSGEVCGIQAVLTTLSGHYQGAPADWYVFASDGLNPTSVLSMTPNLSPGQPALWPNFTVHDIDVADAPVNSPGFFVGYWGNWPGAQVQWFVAADAWWQQPEPLGVPRTNIAPGIGYPSGWRDPSIVWGPTQALGLRPYVIDDQPPNPIVYKKWGAIKRLYYRGY